jgi:1,5-anhydro-D-fructose reductase (1,5-anhydro-D-mannitol-forming)
MKTEVGDMKEIRWGIIGCGDVTEVKSGPGFQKAEGSRLVAVMRRNGDLARDYAERHGVPRWYDDAARLIGDPEVDAVYVATPPSSHKEYALRAAAAGKPVYVEKPMALNARECEEMIAACKAAGVPLFVAYYRRAQPRFVQIKKLIESGELGEIRYVRTLQTKRSTDADRSAGPESQPWRVRPEIAGGGLFFDLASHTLDILDFLLGPIREVGGQASNQAGLYEAEDIVAGSYVFENGAHGTGLWCFDAWADTDLNEMAGTRGKVEFSTFGTEPARVTTDQGVRELIAEHPAHVQQPLIQTIVKELAGLGVCPSTGDTALRTARVMDQMVQSYYGG